MEIFVDDDTKLTLHGLQQYFVRLAENQKNAKLIDLLDTLEFNQVVIFVSKVQRAIELNKLLEATNFPSMCIHGGMKQEQRIAQYKSFKDFEKRILVTTDLFGRGIDIEKVNIVINYDFPQVGAKGADAAATAAAVTAAGEAATSDASDQYLHRVGRAGRFGTKGLAISFISTTEDEAILAQVQSRFSVQVPELPDNIDITTYM